MSRNLILIIALIVAGIFLIYFLINNSGSASTLENNLFPTETPSTNTPSPTQGPVKQFLIVGSNYRFNPNQITVNQNDQVQITFVNSGGTHDFRLDEFNVATKILQGGQQELVTFTADKTGTFEYYCSVNNHRQMGMVGKLIVE